MCNQLQFTDFSKYKNKDLEIDGITIEEESCYVVEGKGYQFSSLIE